MHCRGARRALFTFLNCPRSTRLCESIALAHWTTHAHVHEALRVLAERGTSTQQKSYTPSQKLADGSEYKPTIRVLTDLHTCTNVHKVLCVCTERVLPHHGILTHPPRSLRVGWNTNLQSNVNVNVYVYSRISPWVQHTSQFTPLFLELSDMRGLPNTSTHGRQRDLSIGQP